MRKQPFEIFRDQESYLNEETLHHHDFYEIYVILSGNMNYAVESRQYRMEEGDILLIAPMELHQPTIGNEQLKYERFVLRIGKAYLEQYSDLGFDLSNCFHPKPPGHSNLIRPDTLSKQYLIFMLEQLEKEAESEEFSSGLFVQTFLVQAIILINRLAQKRPESLEIRDKSESVVTGVLTYINVHYNEDLSLDLLANKFFISKYHLSREFNRLVGTSVYRYIIQKRLAVAKQLMSEGVPSTTVYQQCGFGDYSNFYRAFKAEYQISPKEYIAQLKEDAQSAAERYRERSRMIGDFL